jgi:hypothetical protein
MMFPAIHNPTSCEIKCSYPLSSRKNFSAAERNRELCAINSQNIMSEGAVRQWCRVLKMGRTQTHNKVL